MSYMNDDCDPFGVPYAPSNNCAKKVEYSFKDLNELMQNEWDLTQKLNKVKSDKSEAITQLKNKISKYVDTYAEIKCDKYGHWKIIATSFKLSQLENLKKDFDLSDIKVKCKKVKCSSGNYEERIVISLR